MRRWRTSSARCPEVPSGSVAPETSFVRALAGLPDQDPPPSRLQWVHLQVFLQVRLTGQAHLQRVRFILIAGIRTAVGPLRSRAVGLPVAFFHDPAGPMVRPCPATVCERMLDRTKKLLQRLLAIVWIRRGVEAITRLLLEVLAINRVTSLVYSVLSIPTFNREQYAVLRGRRDYYRNLGRARTTRTELRRNVHRLEKGILMRPRREVFALEYLIETIEFYERAALDHAQGTSEPEELAWAFSVLENYFAVVDRSQPRIAEAFGRFEATRAHFLPERRERVPYRHGEIQRSDVTYEDMLALARQRRSTRWFQPRPVPRELVDKALLVARESPSACNRLPYEFRIFDDPDLVARVASIPVGTAGYGHQIPTLAVVIGRLHHYFSPRDRHVVYVDGALASMSFMYALESLGLASSVINWPDFEPLERRMQKALDLADDERVVMLVAIGYADPDGLVAHSEKKPLDVIRSYNGPVRG